MLQAGGGEEAHSGDLSQLLKRQIRTLELTSRALMSEGSAQGSLCYAVVRWREATPANPLPDVTQPGLCP